MRELDLGSQHGLGGDLTILEVEIESRQRQVERSFIRVKPHFAIRRQGLVQRDDAEVRTSVSLRRVDPGNIEAPGGVAKVQQSINEPPRHLGVLLAGLIGAVWAAWMAISASTWFAWNATLRMPDILRGDCVERRELQQTRVVHVR